MKAYLSALSMVLVLLSCTNEGIDPATKCFQGVEATVRNLTGLDGCGYVFELKDGKRLEPIIPIIFCGTPPLPKEITEDPLYQFEFIDGKRVKILYEETKAMSICMVGPVVKITCLEELGESPATTDK